MSFPGAHKRIKRIKRKWDMARLSDPRFLAPEARMTVVKQTPSKYYNAYGASPPPLAFSDFDLTLREEKVLT